MIFRQLFEMAFSTYMDLLEVPDIGEAVLIDPVAKTLQRDLAVIQDLGLNPTCTLDALLHADHISAWYFVLTNERRGRFRGRRCSRRGAASIRDAHGGTHSPDCLRSLMSRRSKNDLSIWPRYLRLSSRVDDEHCLHATGQPS